MPGDLEYLLNEPSFSATEVVSPRRKNVLFVIAILLVLVGVGVGMFFLKDYVPWLSSGFVKLFPSSPSVLPTEAPAFNLDPSSWESYINQTYGFSLSYPRSVSLSEKLFRVGEGGKSQAVYLRTKNGSSLVITTSMEERQLTTLKNEPITIGGLPTVKFYKTATSGFIRSVTSPNGEAIFFSFALTVDPDKAKTDDLLFDRILGTFEFTP